MTVRRRLHHLEVLSASDWRVGAVCRKSSLALLARKVPRLGRVVPRGRFVWNAMTWQSDAESRSQIDGFLKLVQKGLDSEVLVCKLDGTSRGRGVFLVTCKEDLVKLPKRIFSGSGVTVQEYVKHPCLLNGCKWDMRIYVAVIVDVLDLKGVERTFQVFRYKDAFARRSSERYSSDVNSRKVHLTNTFINNSCGDQKLREYARSLHIGLANKTMAERDSLPSLLFEEDEYLSSSVCEECTMTLDAAWEILRTELDDLKVEKARKRVSEVVQVLSDVLQDESLCKEQRKQMKYPREVALLGLDVILDDSMEAYLLEVNQSPDMRCCSCEQLQIKAKLVEDFSELAGFSERPSELWSQPSEIPVFNCHGNWERI